MKYKLIDSVSKIETLCDKVTIDGFDYYVSDEKPKRKSICISKTNAVYQNNQQSLNDKLVFLDKEVVNIHEIIGRVEFGEDSVNLPFDISELKKVIATTNPNIDVPKVVDEVEELSEKFIGCKYEDIEDSIDQIGYDSFKRGYNKSQETHPFSEEDMIEFDKWKNEKYKLLHGEYVDANDYYSIPDLKSVKKYTTKELLQLWKEQKPKIVYYG